MTIESGINFIKTINKGIYYFCSPHLIFFVVIEVKNAVKSNSIEADNKWTKIY